MRKWILACFMSILALGLTVTTIPTEVQAAESTESKKGLVKENGKYYYYKSGKKIKNTLKKLTVDGQAKYYYFGSKGAAYTNKWKTITKSGKKYRYYFGKDGVAYSSGTNSSGKAKEPVVKTISGKKSAFDYKGRALTGVQVINEKFYYFNSNGKMDKTKTNKLRKAAKYEKNFTTLQNLLKKYGCTPKKTKYYNSSCYGDGKDGIITYKNFKISVFKYRKNGKVIFFDAQWRRTS